MVRYDDKPDDVALYHAARAGGLGAVPQAPSGDGIPRKPDGSIDEEKFWKKYEANDGKV